MPNRKEEKKIHSLFFKKPRKKENFFVVEGERAFAELCRSDWKILKTYAEPGMVKKALQLAAPNRTMPIEEISAKKLAELAQTETPPGVLALVEKQAFTLAEAAAEKRILILDNLRDPGNVGTLLRSARSLGWSGVILLKGCAELFSPKVVRSTAGSLFHLKIAADAPAEKAIDYLKEKGFQIWVADSNQGIPPVNVTPPDKLALVIGSEATGVSREVLAEVNQHIKIPLAPGADSLNAAVSGGILMYLLGPKM